LILQQRKKSQQFSRISKTHKQKRNWNWTVFSLTNGKLNLLESSTTDSGHSSSSLILKIHKKGTKGLSENSLKKIPKSQSFFIF
jgi:hypothetical protein